MTNSRLYRFLAWSAVCLTFGLIVLGGVVRITGSGMGCGEHWPLCKGEWFPALDMPTMIEIGHRWAAALVSCFVIALAAVAWWRHRAEPRLRNPATLALVLLVIQVLLGAVTVKLALPPEVIIVHLGNAMILLATLLVAGFRSSPHPLSPSPGPGEGEPAAGSLTALPPYRPTAIAAGLGFVVVLLGALVANYHAGLYCQGFPLCNGSLLPPPTWFGAVHWLHRLAAFLFLGHMIGLGFGLRRRGARQSLRAAMMTVLLTVVQIGIGAAMVLRLLPPELRALHMLVGTAVWASLVRLVWVDRNPVPVGVDPVGVDLRSTPTLWADLVTLTKPRIISLLLVTTVFPMFITGQGTPGFGLVCWVVVGGYLMAGGANAINMWFDRDIDDKMTRTRARPLPSGRMSPAQVLAFGLALGGAAFAIFYYLTTPLAAWLALAGLLFYVFVYTIWLKRISPQNIVIGGAAGAFPPLVGWAAMTGRLDLMALYLFAIIFYWTPPHFWALALIKQGEYGKAGIPMMPVVKGERSTKIQMLGYTIMLVPLTILPWLAGRLGTLYLVTALLLGARLLWFCLKLLKENGVTPTAWKMYKFSLLYLFLLFAAMGADRLFPTANPFHRPDVVVIQPSEILHQH
ncbi:MAG TPA: heme o synthase [Gemmatimonadales bacterium]|nr:heme o synthase [Gemmatimonadales bacterium]